MALLRIGTDGFNAGEGNQVVLRIIGNAEFSRDGFSAFECGEVARSRTAVQRQIAQRIFPNPDLRQFVTGDQFDLRERLHARQVERRQQVQLVKIDVFAGREPGDGECFDQRKVAQAELSSDGFERGQFEPVA